MYLYVDSIILDEALDLLILCIISIDDPKLLRLGLYQELLEGVSVHAGLEWEVTRATFDVYLNALPWICEGFGVLGLKVFESIV